MSIASLVFTQSPYKTPAVFSELTPHKCFYSYPLMVSKASKNFPKISFIPPPPGELCTALLNQKPNIFFVGIRGGVPALHCPSLSKPDGRATHRGQPGAHILPQRRNKWGGRQKSWITNIRFKGENN